MRVPIPDQRVGERPIPVLLPSPPAGVRDGRPGVSGVAPSALADVVHGGGRGRLACPAGVGRALVRPSIVLRRHPTAARGRCGRGLASAFRADTLVETTVRPSDGGLTEKALHRLDDGRTRSNRC